MGKKEDKKDDPQSERPSDGDFQQQNLRAWQPLLTPKWVVGTFIAVGLFFIPIGIIVLISSNNVIELTSQYEDRSGKLPGDQTTTIEMDIEKTMEPPVYMYYKLTNFYQSHRRYVKSRSDQQLRGELDGSFDSCDPLKTGLDDKIAYPCGLIANSFFNDNFTITKDGKPVSVDGAGSGKIAWKSDIDAKFKEVTNLDKDKFTKQKLNGDQLPRVNDEDFIVWMRTAGLPTFKKLKYVINDKLEKGDKIMINVESKFSVLAFGGTKSVVLSTAGWLGGKNDFLGYAYVVVGALCWVLALVFFIKQRISPRALGDMKYFNLKNAQN